MIKIIWLILGGLLLPIPSQAASFDCGKAKSPLEKIICSSPKISRLDVDLAKKYSAAMMQLSDNGKAILKKGQAEWLRHINLVCIKFNKANVDSTTDNPVQCIEEKYEQRVADMQTAAAPIGPFTFSRIDYFFSKKDGRFIHPYDGQTSYPRIDSPLSENAKKWNSIMAETSGAEGGGRCYGSPGDVNVTFDIKSATENIISVKTGIWIYCHGAAHEMWQVRGETYILTPKLRRLMAPDLFDTTKPWKEFVTDKCLAVLKAKADGWEIDNNRVRSIGTNPESWALTKEGLLITFNPNEALPYALGETEVFFTWSELTPFLVGQKLIP